MEHGTDAMQRVAVRRHDLAGMAGSPLVAVVLALALAVTMILAAYVYGGAPVAVVALCTWAVALGGGLATILRRAPARPVAFNFYIGTIVALTALYADEWYWHTPSTLRAALPGAFSPGVGISEHAFIAIFPLAGSGLLLLGALAYYHETWLGQFAAWFTFAWGCMAALAVYALVLIAPSGYVGGMATAPVALLIALLGMRRVTRRPADATSPAQAAFTPNRRK